MAILFSVPIKNVKANLVGEYAVNSQNYANNSSNITAVLSVVSTGEYLNGVSTFNFNGTTYKPYVNLPQWGQQVIASQTFDVQHNAEGNATVTISATCNIAVGRYTASGSGTAPLPQIPRISKPSLITFPNTTYDITIGNEVMIHFNRKSPTFTHFIQLIFGDYVVDLTDNVVGGDNFSWDTSLYADEMYKRMPTSNNKVGKIRLFTYSGSQQLGYSDVDFRGNIINANPIFTNFEYTVTDDKTIELTGNNKTVINKHSNVLVSINETNKAVAQKYATIKKYQLICGDQKVEIPYSENAKLSLREVNNVQMNVYAIDSRGNTTMVSKTYDNFITYEDVNITKFSLSRSNGGVSSESTLSYEGTFWNQNFGSVENQIVSATYMFRESGTTDWTQGQSDISPEIIDGNFSFSDIVLGDINALGFTVEKSFDVKLTITDKISTDEETTILSNGKPAIAISKDGVAIGSKYDNSIGGILQYDGKKFEPDDYTEKRNINDADSATETGTYYTTKTTTNVPETNSSGYLDVKKRDEDNVFQQWIKNKGNQMYIREKNSDTSFGFGDWVKIITGDDLLSLFKFQMVNQQVTIGGNGNVGTPIANLANPSGYTMLGILPLENGYADQWQVSYARYNNQVVAYIKSYYPQQLKSYLKCVVIYIKSNYFTSVMGEKLNE